jgi:hypothetical protein
MKSLKIYKHTIFIFAALCFCFCSRQRADISDNVISLSVNMDSQDKVSVFDLFKKIEIIPLETTDTSLLSSISKIEYYDNRYYILDRDLSKIFCYDTYGNYICNIGKRGNGPEDYFSAEDFLIDKNKKCMVLLSTIGQLYFYNLYTGKLVDKILLKDGPSNYQRFTLINDDVLVFYTIVYEKGKQLFLFSIKNGNFIDSFYQNEEYAFSNDVFYIFNNEVFFAKPFYNEVYKLKESGLELAYSWDFGKMNMNVNKFNLPEKQNERMRQLVDMLRNSQFTSLCDIQIQTDNYYYARSLRNTEQQLHILYNKKTNKTSVFDKFAEDIFFYPLCWHNDFVLAESSFHSNKSAVNQTVLDAENKLKLNQIGVDDNPYIVKYIWRE